MKPHGIKAADAVIGAIICALLSACASNAEQKTHESPPVERFPAIYNIGEPLEQYCFDLEKKADFVISQSSDGTYNIGIGIVTRDGEMTVHHPKDFTADELESFWEQQRHKDFIVVWFDKSVDSNEELLARARRVQSYFFKTGFKRVRIHQGYGFGVGVWCDDLNPSTTSK